MDEARLRIRSGTGDGPDVTQQKASDSGGVPVTDGAGTGAAAGKATPSPWVVEAFANQDEAREQGLFDWTLRQMGDCFDGGPVGVVWQGEGGRQSGLPGCIETGLANARLIAAAPDLLDALRQTHVVAAVAARMFMERGLADVFIEACMAEGVTDGFGVRARMAIAKAEARQ